VKYCKVRFYPENREIEAEEGENLLRVAMAAEVRLNASCGGDGTCGKCRVIIDKGEVEHQPAPALTKEEIDEGYILACRSLIKEDLEIRIPPESRTGRIIEKERAAPSCGHLLSSREWEERLARLKFDPPFKKVCINLPPPSLDDNMSDLERLRRELNRKCNVKCAEVDLLALKALPHALRAGNWQVTVTLLETGTECRVTNIEPSDTAEQHYAVAVDVGTTTVVAQLIDLTNGRILGKKSDYNAQASCGEDVISRIIFSTRDKGLEKLQSLIVGTIAKLIQALVKEIGINPNYISGVFAAGNTTMTHLLLGLDPRYIREEPYIPGATFLPWIKASEIGINIAEHTYLYCFPCVASYIGGDITAGVIASGMAERSTLTLFIDVGTNGEIVLGNKDWLISCSCSAGPAFEGGGVKHGMQATRGAIEQVRIDQNNWEPMILTVGQVKPIGICGTGIIDTIAELFLSKAIDQKGKINLDTDTPRIRMGEFGPEYVLAWADDSRTKGDITLNEADIENLIRAKAAVFAGINILIDSVNLSFSDIEEIIIAGAFGNYLEIEKVVTIGLLPELSCEKFTFIGNGSILGAHAAVQSREVLKEAEAVARKMTYLELSTNTKFMDQYVSALFLPHTNVEKFPKVLEQLKS
jgi:uncharacterized 2Fe-2S/4Fe-4S cluster protein (DUF4445 family)